MFVICSMHGKSSDLQPVAVAALMALSLAGCGPVGDLAIGAAGVTLLAPLVGAAVGGGATVATYCETPQAALYTTDHWHCAKGDTELKPWDYSRMKADRDAAASAAAQADALAEAARPTYCLTAVSRTAYRSPGKTCAPGETSISEDEYHRMRADAAAAMTRLPPSSN